MKKLLVTMRRSETVYQERACIVVVPDDYEVTDDDQPAIEDMLDDGDDCYWDDVDNETDDSPMEIEVIKDESEYDGFPELVLDIEQAAEE